MFDHTIASPRIGEGRGWASLGMAAAGHLALVAGLLCSSYLIIEQVTDPSPPLVSVIPLAPPLSPPPARLAREPASRGARGGAAAPRLGTPRAHVSPAPALPAIPLPDLLASTADPVPADDTAVGVPGPGIEGVPSGTPDGTEYRGVDPKGGPGEGSDGPLLVADGVVPPVLLVKVQPEYPERARVMRLSGRVFVQAVISPQGDVVDVKVVSSTLAVFEESALTAVRQWRYRPATLRGRPVAVYFTVLVSFTLR